MKRRSPYDALGVSTGASDDEIKRAHRKRAKQTHPDTGGTDSEFREVTDAAMVLLDPVRRKRFDETGETEQKRPAHVEMMVGVFVGVLAETINNGQEPKHVDIIAKATTKLRDNLRSANANRASAGKALNRLKQAQGRLTEPDGILGAVLAGEVAKVERDIAGMDAGIPTIEAAIEYMQSCRYDVEKREAVNPFGPAGLLTGMPFVWSADATS